MDQDKPLSDIYHLYITGKLHKKDFEGMIFQYLLGNFERYRHFNGNKDTWNDFLVWLYPRFAKAIDLYREQGSSFDAYINGIVNSAAREYRCRETDHSITEYICWQARMEEITLTDSEPDYPDEKNDIVLPADVNPRQVLFLLLKSYSLVTNEYVSQIAKAIKMDPEHVQEMVDELKKRRSEKEERMHDLRERLYCQHYRCLAFQKRMNISQPGTEYHAKMKLRLERAIKRYRAMKKRLGGMRVSASNRMIADVLGIPRGTVDSGLFAIKNRFAPSCEVG